MSKLAGGLEHNWIKPLLRTCAAETKNPTAAFRVFFVFGADPLTTATFDRVVTANVAIASTPVR